MRYGSKPNIQKKIINWPALHVGVPAPTSGWILATHMPEYWSDDTKSLFPDGTTSNENDFVPGKWTYEVLTYDGNRIKEYTDGRLVNDWPTTGMAIGSGQAMVVGGWPPHTGFQFIGAIDEFQIYKRCLSTGEIQDIYKQAIHPYRSPICLPSVLSTGFETLGTIKIIT